MVAVCPCVYPPHLVVLFFVHFLGPGYGELLLSLSGWKRRTGTDAVARGLIDSSVSIHWRVWEGWRAEWKIRRPSTMTGNTRDNFLSSLRNFDFPFDARRDLIRLSRLDQLLRPLSSVSVCVCVCH